MIEHWRMIHCWIIRSVPLGLKLGAFGGKYCIKLSSLIHFNNKAFIVNTNMNTLYQCYWNIWRQSSIRLTLLTCGVVWGFAASLRRLPQAGSTATKIGANFRTRPCRPNRRAAIRQLDWRSLASSAFGSRCRRIEWKSRHKYRDAQKPCSHPHWLTEPGSWAQTPLAERSRRAVCSWALGPQTRKFRPRQTNPLANW